MVPKQIYQNDGVVGYNKSNVPNFAYDSETSAPLRKKLDFIRF